MINETLPNTEFVSAHHYTGIIEGYNVLVLMTHNHIPNEILQI